MRIQKANQSKLLDNVVINDEDGFLYRTLTKNLTDQFWSLKSINCIQENCNDTELTGIATTYSNADNPEKKY